MQHAQIGAGFYDHVGGRAIIRRIRVRRRRSHLHLIGQGRPGRNAWINADDHLKAIRGARGQVAQGTAGQTAAAPERVQQVVSVGRERIGNQHIPRQGRTVVGHGDLVGQLVAGHGRRIRCALFHGQVRFAKDGRAGRIAVVGRIRVGRVGQEKVGIVTDHRAVGHVRRHAHVDEHQDGHAVGRRNVAQRAQKGAGTAGQRAGQRHPAAGALVVDKSVDKHNLFRQEVAQGHVARHRRPQVRDIILIVEGLSGPRRTDGERRQREVGRIGDLHRSRVEIVARVWIKRVAICADAVADEEGTVWIGLLGEVGSIHAPADRNRAAVAGTHRSQITRQRGQRIAGDTGNTGCTAGSHRTFDDGCGQDIGNYHIIRCRGAAVGDGYRPTDRRAGVHRGDRSRLAHCQIRHVGDAEGGDGHIVLQIRVGCRRGHSGHVNQVGRTVGRGVDGDDDPPLVRRRARVQVIGAEGAQVEHAAAEGEVTVKFVDGPALRADGNAAAVGVHGGAGDQRVGDHDIVRDPRPQIVDQDGVSKLLPCLHFICGAGEF